jgi:hypothetical protein
MVRVDQGVYSDHKSLKYIFCLVDLLETVVVLSQIQFFLLVHNSFGRSLRRTKTLIYLLIK